MPSLNKAMIMGHIGKSEMRYTSSGVAKLEFSVATNNSYKKDNKWVDAPASWHNCILWGEAAERQGPHLDKGVPVFVEGRIDYRTWEGQDGKKQYRTEIIADRVLVLVKGGGEREPDSGPARTQASQPTFDDDGELPFE